jgi:hypothetical protein
VTWAASRQSGWCAILLTLTSTAAGAARGAARRTRLSIFATISFDWLDRPVTLVPGWASVLTKAEPTGSATATMTMGVRWVALRASRVDGVQVVTMTSKSRAANSGAKPGKRPTFLSA